MEEQALDAASASPESIHPADAHLSPQEAMATLNKDFAPLEELMESVTQARAADQSLDDKTYLNISTMPAVYLLGSKNPSDSPSAHLNNLIMGREHVRPWKQKHLQALEDELISLLNMEDSLWRSMDNEILPMQERKKSQHLLWEETVGKIQPLLKALKLDITLYEQLGASWDSNKGYDPIDYLVRALHGNKFTSPREILDADLQNLYAAMFYSVFRGVSNALHYTQRSKPTPEGIATFDPAGLRDILLPYFTEEEKLKIYSTMKKISAVQGNPEKLREKILPGTDLIPVVSNLSWARILEFSSLVEEYNVEWAVAAMEWA